MLGFLSFSELEQILALVITAIYKIITSKQIPVEQTNSITRMG